MTACVLALGFFDGVHIGHGGLLTKTAAVADALGLTAAALTFDRHPDALLTGQPVPLLNTLEERKALMAQHYGIHQVHVLPFDEALRDQHWEDFAREILLERFQARCLICGHDFRFGKGGAGTPEKLAAFCAARGIGFHCIPEISLEGQTVSSTLIRRLLLEGEAERACRFLGHPHLLTGKVVEGRKIGRALGTPTANLQTEPQILLPKNGVYAAKAYLEDQTLLAVVNIGTRPTFQGQSVTIEPWLLDFSGDLYGKTLHLALYAYLREERPFSDCLSLKDEILRNAQQTRAYFETRERV